MPGTRPGMTISLPKESPMLSDADRNKAADILMAAEKERKQATQLT